MLHFDLGSGVEGGSPPEAPCSLELCSCSTLDASESVATAEAELNWSATPLGDLLTPLYGSTPPTRPVNVCFTLNPYNIYGRGASAAIRMSFLCNIERVEGLILCAPNVYFHNLVGCKRQIEYLKGDYYSVGFDGSFMFEVSIGIKYAYLTMDRAGLPTHDDNVN